MDGVWMIADLEDYLVIKKIPYYHCIRCGYEWLKGHKKPQTCPKCRSIYWDKKRKYKTKSSK